MNIIVSLEDNDDDHDDDEEDWRCWVLENILLPPFFYFRFYLIRISISSAFNFAFIFISIVVGVYHVSCNAYILTVIGALEILLMTMTMIYNAAAAAGYDITAELAGKTEIDQARADMLNDCMDDTTKPIFNPSYVMNTDADAKVW